MYSRNQLCISHTSKDQGKVNCELITRYKWKNIKKILQAYKELHFAYQNKYDEKRTPKCQL